MPGKRRAETDLSRPSKHVKATDPCDQLPRTEAASSPQTAPPVLAASASGFPSSQGTSGPTSIREPPGVPDPASTRKPQKAIHADITERVTMQHTWSRKRLRRRQSSTPAATACKPTKKEEQRDSMSTTEWCCWSLNRSCWGITRSGGHTFTRLHQYHCCRCCCCVCCYILRREMFARVCLQVQQHVRHDCFSGLGRKQVPERPN